MVDIYKGAERRRKVPPGPGIEPGSARLKSDTIATRLSWRVEDNESCSFLLDQEVGCRGSRVEEASEGGAKLLWTEPRSRVRVGRAQERMHYGIRCACVCS